MNIIEKCIKESESINSEYVNSPQLPKLKLYLKILGFSYLAEGTNQPITSEIVTSEIVTEAIQQMYIFKDVTLTLKPYIIKVLSNSDSAVVWINIWDSKNGSIAKSIINQCFNMRKYIATICDTNMNLGVPQCKNYWKWGYSTLMCQSHTFRCSKCYGPYNTKHHREKA